MWNIADIAYYKLSEVLRSSILKLSLLTFDTSDFFIFDAFYNIYNDFCINLQFGIVIKNKMFSFNKTWFFFIHLNVLICSAFFEIYDVCFSDYKCIFKVFQGIRFTVLLLAIIND